MTRPIKEERRVAGWSAEDGTPRGLSGENAREEARELRGDYGRASGGLPGQGEGGRRAIWRGDDGAEESGTLHQRTTRTGTRE